MTDHKFTGDDVIKALECCMKTERAKDCELMKCPACYKDGCIYFDRADSYDEYSVYKELTKDALALINRQKAEIERLQCQVNRLKKYDEERDIRLHARLTENARAKAIKEFAERLKVKVEFTTIAGYRDYCRLIDNLVKEMTEEQK